MADGQEMQRALVCDDDSDIRSLVGAILESHAFTVLHAGDVASAIELLAGREVDLVVTDIGLPDGSGVAVCQAADGIGARVVAMTATVGPDLTDALDACSAVLLEKPFSLAELLDAVKS